MLKMLLLVGLGAVVLAVLITTLILLLSGTEEVQPVSRLPSKDVGLRLSLTRKVIEPGENLRFEVVVINLGSGSNFGVALTNEI